MMIYQGFWNYACDLIQIPIQETIKWVCLSLIYLDWISLVKTGMDSMIGYISGMVNK